MAAGFDFFFLEKHCASLFRKLSSGNAIGDHWGFLLNLALNFALNLDYRFFPDVHVFNNLTLYISLVLRPILRSHGLCMKITTSM